MVGFTSHQHRISHGDFSALMGEEDLRCPPVHYFKHEQAELPMFHNLAYMYLVPEPANIKMVTFERCFLKKSNH
jgi:hypothetical protein